MKNRKGFTVIELVVSFVLISIIVVGMLTIALRYRNDAQLSTQKLEVERYKDTLTKEIQEDILEYGVSDINYCTAGGSSIQTCLIFTFQDGTTKNLQLVNTNVLDRYIRYGGHKFPIEEYFPIEPVGLEDASIRLPSKIHFLREKVGENSVFKIDIPIDHVDLEGDYGIHIVALGNF